MRSVEDFERIAVERERNRILDEFEKLALQGDAVDNGPFGEDYVAVDVERIRDLIDKLRNQ